MWLLELGIQLVQQASQGCPTGTAARADAHKNRDLWASADA
jgi:hypothetical protein